MKRVYFIVFAFLFTNTILNADELIVMYGYQDAPPYAFIKDGKLVAGVKKDISEELKKILHIDIKYINVPRKRAEHFLLSGKAHIELIANPSWYVNVAEYNWTEPIFQEHDVFVIDAQNKTTIKNQDDLKGKYIGTMLGYIYPSLNKKFADKTFYRDDAESLDKNFKKLKAKRIDAFISSDVLANYYIKTHKNTNDFFFLKKPIETNNIYVLVSKKSPISFEKIKKALSKLKSSGKIKEILNKYK